MAHLYSVQQVEDHRLILCLAGQLVISLLSLRQQQMREHLLFFQVEAYLHSLPQEDYFQEAVSLVEIKVVQVDRYSAIQPLCFQDRIHSLQTNLKSKRLEKMKTMMMTMVQLRSNQMVRLLSKQMQNLP